MTDTATIEPATVAKHPEFTDFQEVGSVDVDSGTIWIGDPCYVLKDEGESRPSDLGTNWHDICGRFFERSGYDARSKEWRSYSNRMEFALYETPEWRAFMERTKGKPPSDPETRRETSEIMQAFYLKYQKENPFVATSVDKGVAEFSHDLGHGGMGVMLSTFYGDGGYPVYIQYGKNGRPRRVLIDFDPGGDDSDDDND